MVYCRLLSSFAIPARCRSPELIFATPLLRQRADGLIVGPDHSGTFQKFQRELWGYTKFRNELLRRLSAGESDNAVISWLVQIKELKLIRPGKNQPLDRGTILQKQLAQQYLALMEKGRRQACWETLSKATPEQALRRIIKVRQQAKS
jgi:hypothetical protein